MNKKVWLLLIVSAILSGCVSHLQLGINAYNQGKYDVAAALWNYSAKTGNPAAQHNLGILWEDGLGSTPKNVGQAAQWYLLAARQGYIPSMVSLARIQKQAGYDQAAESWLSLAARWGNTDAARLLTSWGKPVPQPDLLRAKQQYDAEQQTAFMLSLIDSFVKGYTSAEHSSKSHSSYNNQTHFSSPSFTDSELINSKNNQPTTSMHRLKNRQGVTYRKSFANPDKYYGSDGSTLERSLSNDRILRSDNNEVEYRRSLANPDRYDGSDGTTLRRSISNPDKWSTE
jgi:hypothetical protein